VGVVSSTFRKKVFRFYLAGGGNDGAIMFIRFFSGEIDEFSHVSAGLFSTAYKLLDDEVLPDYEYCALMEPMRWFDLHLKAPFDYRLKPASLADRSICWFRSTAHEHLAKAWEMVAILEARDIFIWTVRCDQPGYVIYEDAVQVLAYPFPDVRRLL